MNQHNSQHQPLHKTFTANSWAAIAVIIGTILFYLLTHHKRHLLEVLLYLLIAAMMLMHARGHSGHGGQGHKNRSRK